MARLRHGHYRCSQPIAFLRMHDVYDLGIGFGPGSGARMGQPMLGVIPVQHGRDAPTLLVGV